MVAEKVMVSRAEAKARGVARYYPGSTCPRGHTDWRYTANGSCVSCCTAASVGATTQVQAQRAERLAQQVEDARREGAATVRKVALGAGLTHYNTGKPCPKGHTGARFASNGMCVTCVEEHKIAWRAANRERQLAADRAWRSANRERMREASLARYAADPERARKKARQHYARHPERMRDRAKQYSKKNPDKIKASLYKYRARKYLAPQGDRESVHRFLHWLRTAKCVRCYWCKQLVSLKKRHADHIIPLSKGGAHSAANLCASCASCNQHKQARLPQEFAGQSEITFAA